MAKSRFGILNRICESGGVLGAVLCAVVCLGLPAVSATLGVAGITFLRDDRLLIPLEVLCCGAFLWNFQRGRLVHGRHIATWFAFVAAGVFLGSMFLTPALSKGAIALALLFITVATTLNQVFLNRSSCSPGPSPQCKGSLSDRRGMS